MDGFEQNADLKVGDVVVATSGSPDMMVTKLEDGTVHCRWYERSEKEWRNESFPAACLRRSQPKKATSFAEQARAQRARKSSAS